MECDGSGLDRLAAPGEHLTQTVVEGKGAASWRIMQRNSPQGRPFSNPNPCSVMSPMSRDVMVRAQSAKWDLAHWWYRGMDTGSLCRHLIKRSRSLSEGKRTLPLGSLGLLIFRTGLSSHHCHSRIAMVKACDSTAK